MADFTGASRTNYVTIEDMPGLMAYLSGSNITLEEQEGKHAFFPSESSEGMFDLDFRNDEGEEVHLDWEEVMQYIKQGEVLVVMSAGHERLRYISGYSQALIRRPDGTVDTSELWLSQIYNKAAAELGVNPADITSAEY